MLRYLWAGLALGSVALAAGCSCCPHQRTCSSGPAIVSSAPLPPAPCCGGAVPPSPAAVGPTGPVYSSPVPLYPNSRP